MLTKISSALVLAGCIALASCNGNDSKIESSAPAVAAPAENSLENSLKLAEQEFAKDSSNLNNRITLAANYYAAGNLDRAQYHFLKAYGQDNNNLIALTNLGNIYYDSQHDALAIEYYEKALKLDPNNVDMRCDLATNYMNLNHLDKAIEILRENIKINPIHGKTHHNLAVILKKAGNLKEAEIEMKEYEKLQAASAK